LYDGAGRAGAAGDAFRVPSALYDDGLVGLQVYAGGEQGGLAAAAEQSHRIHDHQRFASVTYRRGRAHAFRSSQCSTSIVSGRIGKGPAGDGDAGGEDVSANGSAARQAVRRNAPRIQFKAVGMRRPSMTSWRPRSQL
jgi:hypothetical protein